MKHIIKEATVNRYGHESHNQPLSLSSDVVDGNNMHRASKLSHLMHTSAKSALQSQSVAI